MNTPSVRPLALKVALLFRFVALSYLLLSGLVVIRATDNQEVDAVDVRQLARQGEKALRKGDVDGAEKLFLKAIEADPANPDLKARLAYVYLKSRKLRRAYDISFELAEADKTNSN